MLCGVRRLPDVDDGFYAEFCTEQMVGNLAGGLLRSAQSTLALEGIKAFAVGNCCGSLLRMLACMSVSITPG
jgi:hypothetical protein